MNHITLLTSAAAFVFCAAPTHADSSGFTGFYAPKTWTATGVGFGDASAVFTADGSQLVLTGGDGAGAQTSTITHAVLADGVWSFDWIWFTVDSNSGFDLGYYLLNGVKHDISLGGVAWKYSGHADVPVVAGDVIGWQVVAADGIFGPGYLRITNFDAPVPGPSALALLGLAMMPRPPCRRRG